MAITKNELFNQMELDEALRNDGVFIPETVLKHLDFENTVMEQVHACFNMNHEAYKATKLPQAFRLASSNYRIQVSYRHDAPYNIQFEGGAYLLYKGKKLIDEISFVEKPLYYDKRTSDGTRMATVAQEVGKTKITVAYSNECALKDKGLDCKFCNINQTRSDYAELEGLNWKTPQQIAETVKEAYAEGYQRITITGGFVPERREVEYYIDVAEAIRDVTGLEDFGGAACVGAPADLDVIDKYKEAGYSAISSNMEIWDANIFKTICPGKEQICGGRENWINALKHEVEVFGKGNVRSYFVAGIEPKSTLLEGIEYLTSLGVVAIPLQWLPNPGSELEGHRAPKTEWYQDLYLKTYNLLRQNGLTHLDYYNSTNAENSVFDYLYDSDGDILPWERHNQEAIQFAS